MSLKESKKKTLRFLGDHFLYSAVTVLCKSLKIEKINSEVIENLTSKNQNYILAFWHGTMLLPWFLHGNPNFVALTSKSKDGDILANILGKWNYKVVRGSSSKGGNEALENMIEYVKNKYSIAITPDGPRGPRHEFKPGAVITAKKSGVPIVLAGVSFKKKKVLNNWDKFEIPYFFSSAKIIYSEPFYVNKDLTYEDTSEMILICGRKLNELQKQAEIID